MTLLNKQSAAQILGVSIRSLERYTRKGIIKVTKYERSKTRPAPFYAESDIAQLKQTLEPPAAHMGGNAAIATQTTLESVAFRLAPEHLTRLTEDGKTRGMSAGTYARLLVINALEDSERLLLHEQITELRYLLRLLADDLASATVAILLHGGQVEEVAEARQWVLANLKAAIGIKKG